MHHIETGAYRIEIGPLENSGLRKLLQTSYTDAKKVILVDENTHAHCLDYVLTTIEEFANAEIIEVPSGEEHKQLEIARSIWEALSEFETSRFDLLVNLGGGMLTDLGGFVAACYKRGMDFINIPTSLLGMVDASIGGKTAVNLDQLKNQIGVFANPVALYIDPAFLDTLDETELAGGFAEMLKHGLISDRVLFDRVKKQMSNLAEIDTQLLLEVIDVKNKIVQLDPFERNIRKKLNFGHTVGHAIEGHFISRRTVNHGYCVAIGMLIESYVSLRRKMLSEQDYVAIADCLLSFYEVPAFTDEDIHEILHLMRNDKKNKAGKIRCSLLRSIGDCVVDIELREAEFVEALLHFKNFHTNLN